MDDKTLKCEKESKLMAEMKTEGELKFEKLKGEMNKIIEEKSAEISKLREKLNEKPKVAEVGEHFVVGDSQYKVTFGDMLQRTIKMEYESETFTLNNYDFKIYMRFITIYYIEFAVYIGEGNNTQSKWPLTNKLTLTVLRKDGRVYNNHKFSYTTSPEEWKYCYGYFYLEDSRIAFLIDSIINNNEVSLILTVEE